VEILSQINTVSQSVLWCDTIALIRAIWLQQKPIRFDHRTDRKACAFLSIHFIRSMQNDLGHARQINLLQCFTTRPLWTRVITTWTSLYTNTDSKSHMFWLYCYLLLRLGTTSSCIASYKTIPRAIQSPCVPYWVSQVDTGYNRIFGGNLRKSTLSVNLFYTVSTLHIRKVPLVFFAVTFTNIDGFS